MLDLKIKSDLQRLVDEGLEESLTLDYKDSRALTRDGKGPDELCKDVTALANSAGGQLVYGIEEDKVTKKPSRVDDGVADPKITREWIEQILNSRVQPRLSEVTTARIDMENGQFGYVITVPPTQSGPHQAPDQKYYRRFDLQSVPMHDYEIKDIMRRSTTPDLYTEITFDNMQVTRGIDAVMSTGYSGAVILHCTVKNRSSTPAYHAIVDLLIDADMQVPFALDPFKQIGERDEAAGPKMRIYRRAINSPPHLPIFKEGQHESHTAALAIQIPNDHLNSAVISLETAILAPGFSSTEKWTLQTYQSRLSLYGPGHPRNR
jgi:hypothetical protein